MVKKLGTLVSKESEIIHSPFHGERVMGREAINAKIRTNNTTWQDVKLHSYSPFGIEFVNDNINLKQGQSIDIRIKLAGDETEFNGLVVTSVHEHDGLKLVGVRTFKKDNSDPQTYSGAERRTHRRWSCSDDFLPTGTAPNPVRYNDYILFRVEDISSGGLKLITSMRNKFLGIGQRLECTISLPYVGTVKADVKLKHVNTTFYRGKEFMVMGVEFIKKDTILMKSLGEYLLNFAKDVTVKSLNSEGFGLKTVSKWLDFSYVKTEEEYKEVLELRYKAYKKAGKINSEQTIADMADEVDALSNILVAKYNGKIIGSLRYFTPKEVEEAILGIDKSIYLKNFPSPNKLLVSSRFCIENNFRKADLTYQFIAYLVLLAAQHEKTYVYTSTPSEDLKYFYEQCGAKKMGIFFTNKLTGMKDEIMILNIYDSIIAKNIKPKIWVALYSDVSEYLINKLLIEVNAFDKLRMWFYRKIYFMIKKHGV